MMTSNKSWMNLLIRQISLAWLYPSSLCEQAIIAHTIWHQLINAFSLILLISAECWGRNHDKGRIGTRIIKGRILNSSCSSFTLIQHSASAMHIIVMIWHPGLDGGTAFIQKMYTHARTCNGTNMMLFTCTHTYRLTTSHWRIHSQNWYSHWGRRFYFKVAAESFPSWDTSVLEIFSLSHSGSCLPPSSF